MNNKKTHSWQVVRYMKEGANWIGYPYPEKAFESDSLKLIEKLQKQWPKARFKLFLIEKTIIAEY